MIYSLRNKTFHQALKLNARPATSGLNPAAPGI
jgi:hypothetical protein